MKILFFVRRYNDIDHTIPIVYRVAKDGIQDIEVLCINPTLDINNDFRLKFLRENYHVKIDYVYRSYCPTFFHWILSRLICGAFDPKILKFSKKYVFNPVKIASYFFLRYLYKRFYKKLIIYYSLKNCFNIISISFRSDRHNPFFRKLSNSSCEGKE